MEGLGIDPKYLIIQIANIAIFYFLFTKFLLKPIIRILDDRKRKIAESMENAEKIKEELRKLEELKEEEKKKLKDEEKRIFETAKSKAQREVDEILLTARKKGAKAITDATEAASNIEKEAAKKAEVQELRLIEEIITKIMGEKLNDIEIKAKYQKVMSELHV